VDGRVEVRVTVARAGAGPPLAVTAAVAGRRASVWLAPDQVSAVVTVTVPDPALWWPRGYGEPVRHPLTVTLHSGPSILDTWERSIGFRSLAFDPDRVAFTVNGVPIPVRGVNWIPDDAFVTRVDRARYAARLGQAVEAGVNYVRVWGGGRYESADFYDLADSLGLLVGQDFLFACAAYPEEEPLASEVAAEAREQVIRLAPHPSLVLWVGGNETVWGFHDWGWEPELAGRTWGLGYYEKLLPDVVADVDPTRPYLPNTPYSGHGRHPNDPDHGSTHVWDVWNTHDYTHYRSYRPRFVGEFGFQGPPAYATLRRAGYHQKAHDGDAKLRRGIDGHLPEPVGPGPGPGSGDWHWATQLNQARAIRFGVEHFRSLRPYCSGTIVWQLNDCWPVVSWSTVDGDGRRKPLWYALRRAYAVRLLTFQPRSGGLALVAVNDSASPWSFPLHLSRSTVDGRELASSTMDITVPAGDAVTVPVPPAVAVPDTPAAELVVAVAPGVDRALWFFVEDVDLAVPPPSYEVAVDGSAVTVRARTLLRDVALFPDRLDPDAEVDDALVTLLPGESVRFTVRSGQTLDPAAFAGPPVFRCAADLHPPTLDAEPDGGPV
jgi:beta-mannosidase